MQPRDWAEMGLRQFFKTTKNVNALKKIDRTPEGSALLGLLVKMFKLAAADVSGICV